MSDRLCGYCRKPGHVNSKCDVRLEQIRIIKTHVGNQRKLAQRILLANGVGVGAIVTAFDGWTGEEMACLVPSIKVYDDFVDWKCIKYKKQVRAILGTYGDILPEPQCDGLIRYNVKRKIAIPVYAMHDMSKTLTAYFFLDQLPNPVLKVTERMRGWDYNKPSTILSPNEESDVTDADLMLPFHMHERLTLKKQGSNLVDPIITW